VPGFSAAATLRKSPSVACALRIAAAMLGSLSAAVAISSRAAFSNMLWAASGVAARRPMRTMNGVFPANIDVICAMSANLAIPVKNLAERGFIPLKRTPSNKA
jgi:hypothetical protein